MTDSTITAANSIFTLMAAGLYPVPVQLKGYAADKAVLTEALELAEVLMGVDCRMSAGYVANPSKQTITLQADSPSRSLFAGIIQATKTLHEVFWLSGNIVLPATGESFTLTRGVLTTANQIPGVEKLLRPLDYIITWESIDAALI